MTRTIVVGDVHGCSAELDALLEAVELGSHDRLVFVGDLVARGPDSRGVLAIVRRTGAIALRGNHEDKVLRWWTASAAHARGEGPPPKALGRVHAQVVRQLRPRDWALLASSPLSLELADHALRVVHAGLLPGVPFEAQDPRTLMTIRTVDRSGRAVELGPGTPWGALYEGPPHVVFGHDAQPGLQLHAWATGLDTGCVYGGRLTALVLDPGEPVPRELRARRARLVSVPARKAYFRSAKVHAA